MIWILILLLPAVVAAGALYQTIAAARDERRFPPPGRMIESGNHRIHAHLSDGPGPTVVFEAGIAASSMSWELVRRKLAGIARSVVYDRAGLGWSEAASSPRTLENILSDLRNLQLAPFVLVGHSFGGLLALEYARRHREDVLGLVLVDALTACEWSPVSAQDARSLARGVRLARRGALLARIGVVRFALSLLSQGSRRVPKWMARASSGKGATLAERLVGEIRKLPPEIWPVVQAHWCTHRSFKAMAHHLESLPGIASECSIGCDLGDLPLIVLSASDASPARMAAHRHIVKQSRKGRLIVAENSGHWIQLDQPELVVSAVRDVIAKARVNTPA